MKPCIYRAPHDDDHFGCANFVDLIHPGYVPKSVCETCPYARDPGIRGAGDLLSKALKVVGINKTPGCKCSSKQKVLNNLLPFKANTKDSKWFVAVTSAPRRDSTLHACVASLRACGWEPIVFAEPGTPIVSDDIEYIWNKNRYGVWYNWLNACKTALKSGAQFIMTVQDDAYFHPDSKTYAESILWPDPRAGFLSLYTPSHYASANPQRQTVERLGVFPVVTKALWGACALIWDPVVLSEVINHKIAKNWKGVPPSDVRQRKAVMQEREQNRWKIQNSDSAIGMILNAMGKSMWFVSPSPVRHIAEHSSIGHGGNAGKRNCGLCADLHRPLKDQVPEFNFMHRYEAGCERLTKLGWDKDSFWIPKSLWTAIRDRVRPGMHTLEFGVGVSTTAFEAATDHTAIESDKKLASKYRCAYHIETTDGWYNFIPQKRYDVILVDGPYKGDRSKFLTVLDRLVKETTIIFIDDTQRELEKNLANEVAKRLGKTVKFTTDPDTKYNREWGVIE